MHIQENVTTLTTSEQRLNNIQNFESLFNKYEKSSSVQRETRDPKPLLHFFFAVINDNYVYSLRKQNMTNICDI